MTDQLFEQVRRASRMVADRAKHVAILYDRVPAFAASLPVEKAVSPALDPRRHYLGHQADTVAFLLTLDAINFGSGYFPDLHKRPGMSGYFTIASCLNDLYRKQGPLTAERLAEITVAECTRIFDQDPANQPIRELMQHFTIALNDLGRYLLDHFSARFTALVEAAASSAGRLVMLLKKMPYFNDVEPYEDLTVPFYKRAQISASDLSIAFGGRGWGHFNDLDQLTIFADNLVPHVLRVEGILVYEADLLARIDSGALIPAGSAEEVEIRACAVHAVELIRDEILRSGTAVTSSGLDHLLWNRGQQPRYKAIPRHRTRCTFY